MKIHCSAKFSDKTETYHNDFNIEVLESQIARLSDKITNLAIGKFKAKCDEVFEIDFAAMVFFEVYFYDKESKEITIFKKEKI
jgi:hypothetical protein